jgi:hypothetical protein
VVAVVAVLAASVVVLSPLQLPQYHLLAAVQFPALI